MQGVPVVSTVAKEPNSTPTLSWNLDSNLIPFELQETIRKAYEANGEAKGSGKAIKAKYRWSEV